MVSSLLQPFSQDDSPEDLSHGLITLRPSPRPLPNSPASPELRARVTGRSRDRQNQVPGRDSEALLDDGVHPSSSARKRPRPRTLSTSACGPDLDIALDLEVWDGLIPNTFTSSYTSLQEIASTPPETPQGGPRNRRGPSDEPKTKKSRR